MKKPKKPPVPKKPDEYVSCEFFLYNFITELPDGIYLNNFRSWIIGKFIEVNPFLKNRKLFLFGNLDRFKILNNVYNNEIEVSFRVEPEDKIIKNKNFEQEFKLYEKRIREYPAKLKEYEAKLAEWVAANQEEARKLKEKKIAAAKKLLKEAGEL